MTKHKWHKEIVISIIVLISLTGCWHEKCVDGKLYYKENIIGTTSVYEKTQRECLND